MHDRVVIQELLKKVAQANQIDTSSQKDFKGNGFSGGDVMEGLWF